MKNYSNTLEGKCHCGNIHFTFGTNKAIEEFIPRACSCDLCKQHGAVYVSDPDGHVSLHFENKDQVTFYRFGHKTSDFIICKECGVLMMALCEVGGSVRAVINKTPMLNHNFPTEQIRTDFESESPEERLARRQKNWTGSVEIG